MPLVLDPSFIALRWLLGAEVPDGHPFASPMMASFLPSYERRYRRLMDGVRVRFGEARLQDARHRLSAPDQRGAAEAELHAACTVAATPTSLLDAPEPGTAAGVRTADFVVHLGETSIDLEVRTLTDAEDEREVDAVSDRITRKLTRLTRPTGLRLSVRVREVTPELQEHRFDRSLVAAVRKLIDGKSVWTGSARVTLPPKGPAGIWDGRTSLAGELVGIELAETKLPGFIGSSSGLCAPTEAERVMKALKKKSSRRQRTGDRPWVIALDTSGTALFVDEELVRGAREFLRSSRSISAVVFQRRTLRADGGFSFRSRVVPNEKPTYPLTTADLAAFEIDDL